MLPDFDRDSSYRHRCLETSLQSAPGLGFYLCLTSGYVVTPVFDTLAYEKSTAEVSENVNHIKDIINIPEYITSMQEFTTNTNRLNRPPLNTIDQRLSFVWEALKRRINLFLGRPGSPNAATLSSMLKLLRSETESRSLFPSPLSALPFQTLLSNPMKKSMIP
jgi:hypothetical protein